MPAGELYIYSESGSEWKDAWETWGVSMEDTALASLMTPPSMKDSISNESRLEHGTRRINLLRKKQERELTLPFHLVAKSRAQYLTRYENFVITLSDSEYVKIKTCYQPTTIYKCIYVSCTQFNQFIDGLAKFSLKLIEPNPSDRTDD